MGNNNQTLYNSTTVPELFLSAFKAYPDRTALIDTKQHLTYREVAAKSFQIARLLQSKDMKRQDTVALLLSNSIDSLITLIAVQLMGLRYISLHPMASESDHAFVLQDSGTRMLIADAGKFPERTQALHQQKIVEQVLTLAPSPIDAGLLQQASTMSDTPITIETQPGDYTKISYSGGTTGRSKGILQTHRTAVTMVNYQLAHYEWPQAIRFLATTPISHAAGSFVLPIFLRGGAMYLLDKYSAETFMEYVQQHQINATFMVPTQIYGLLDSPQLEQANLSSLELILYGASPMAPARLQEALKKIGPVFGQLYGQAEAPMVISYLRKEDHDPAHPHLLRSCGRVIPGNQVKLLDAELNEVPPGEIGEICVRGPLVMEGYLNRPEENEKVFAGQWLHTGDMAREDEQGYLYIVDRAKDMIISGGFNVYPSEIENCLATHPAIAMSAVIGVPHEKWGEEVTAVVVLKPGLQPTKEELIDFILKEKGPVNTPKAIFFEEQLPLTSLGKIDKKTIRSKFWNQQDRQVS
ncbi:AMP-binding protein [Advenella sp. RU8]|uniref:AMP-binding protein n=1 Tax=Advenella sp. RU8 TaxID=3399575 RepID=UPI003AADCFAF